MLFSVSIISNFVTWGKIEENIAGFIEYVYYVRHMYPCLCWAEVG